MKKTKFWIEIRIHHEIRKTAAKKIVLVFVFFQQIEAQNWYRKTKARITVGLNLLQVFKQENSKWKNTEILKLYKKVDF